jgi:DNA polymerase
MRVHIDLETRSSIDINSGVDKYISAPDFKILLISYAIDNGPVVTHDLYTQIKPIPQEIIVLLKDSRVTKVAHNAVFEYMCFQNELGFKLDLEAWECTMVRTLVAGLPPKLEQACKALNLEQQKMKTTLINWFCKPISKCLMGKEKDVYRSPREYPDKWAEFTAYNRQDVAAERDLDNSLLHIPVEWALWWEDFKINRRGVAIDLNLIKNIIKIDGDIKEDTCIEIEKKAGLKNPNSLPELKRYISLVYGVNLPEISKKSFNTIMETEDIPDKVKELIKLRLSISSTATKKYLKMMDMSAIDGRVRGLFRFYGASRTGRWAGKGIQPQNMYRSSLKYEDLKTARELVKQGINPCLVYGEDALCQLIRTAFVGNLSVIDFSSIEARVLAWLAGEVWANKIFSSHGRIYEAQAAKMYNVSLEDVTKELRRKGKIATLALGYQGSIGALQKMGYVGTLEEMQDIVDRWRETNPNIVQLWYQVDRAVKQCITHGTSMNIKNKIWIQRDSKWLHIQLPSGRRLYYFRPAVENRTIKYYGIDNQDNRNYGIIHSYGGKIVENIVQAIARDILAVNILRLANEKIVMHIHDEIIVEDCSLKKLKLTLEQNIDWAPGLVLKAEGFESDFYMKEV